MFTLRVYGSEEDGMGVLQVGCASGMAGARRVLEAAGFMVEVEDGGHGLPETHSLALEGRAMFAAARDAAAGAALAN
jgi:hypothetical protein